jgi:arylsulfatase A-like enzyme
VPLILHVPGVGSSVRDAPVSIIDIAPTLCALAGLDAGCGGLDGRSLLAPDGPHRTPAYSEVYKKGRGVVLTSLVTERFHLIRDMLEQRVELFDVVLDPNEHRNLAHRFPERTRELLELHTHAPLSRQAEVFGAFDRDRDALALARALPKLEREALVLEALDLLHSQRSRPVVDAVALYLEAPGASRKVRARADALFGAGSGLAPGRPE